MVRLSLPTRVPITGAFIYAFVFLCIQQFEHTNLGFSLLYFAFLMLGVVAFNFAEGFTRLTGAYIFWYGMLVVIFGVTWKAVIGEAGETNLQAPVLTMALYAASMGMMVFVALINRKFDFRHLGIGGGLSSGELNYSGAGLGCMMATIVLFIAGNVFGQVPGGIVSALLQINFFAPLGIVLATIGAMKDSGSRRTFNWVNGLGVGLGTAYGLISFSKQQMLTPLVCWLLGAFYMRLKVRLIHVVGGILFLWFAFGFAGPLSQSRDLVPSDQDLGTIGRAELVIYEITHWKEFKQHVQALNDYESSGGPPGYYDTAQGSLVERLSMISPDDRLIAYSSRGHFEGLDPVVNYFENLVPHFLAPEKQILYSGNHYAHEMGSYLAANDFTTGISFSPLAEAYHCEGWGGIFWVLPAIWLILFQSVDFIVSDMQRYPWGLLVVVWFAHAAPESLLSGMIYFIGYGNFGMVLAIIWCTRLAPVLGALFIGQPVSRERGSIGRARPILARPQGPVKA